MEHARQRALDATLIAHRHLLSALKHLAGHRVPMGGLSYDLESAIRDLRVVQAKTTEAIQLLEPEAPGGDSGG
jgi:hypothetical protein